MADSPLGAGELALDERHLVALPLDGPAFDNRRATLLRRVKESLALHAPVVDEDECDALRRRCDVRLQLVRDRVRRLGDIAQDDDRGLAEERRAGQAGDPSRLEPGHRQVVDLGRWVGGPRSREDLGDRAVPEQVLRPGHEGQGRDHRGHATRAR